MFSNRKPKGRINYPENRHLTPRLFRAKGTIDSLPAGQRVVLVVQVSGLLWPKGEVKVNGASWTSEVHEGGMPPGGNFTLSLFTRRVARGIMKLQLG